jgi:hypothetical protein
LAVVRPPRVGGLDELTDRTTAGLKGGVAHCAG